MPQSTANASATKSRLLNRNVASRETGDSIRCGERRRCALRLITMIANAAAMPIQATNHQPMLDRANVWMLEVNPLRVKNVPVMQST